MKIYVEYVVAYDEDLDIVKKRSKWRYLAYWSLNCIMYLRGHIMYTRIECEFMRNKTRGSMMNKKLNNIISMCILWWRDDGLKGSISKLKYLSKVIT